MTLSVPFTVEDVHQGWPNQPILYRIRVPARETGTSHTSEVIRYLTAPQPPKGASGIPDFRGELLAFDAVPAGDWNLGRLVVPGGDSAEGNFILASTEMAQLKETAGLLDAGPVWCDRKVDLVDLLDALDSHRKSEIKSKSKSKSDQADDDDDDDVVLLQGFGGSFETTDTDREVLDRELEGLERVLAQRPSELEGCNAPIDVDLSNRLVEFQSHGLTHPFVHWQLGNSGRVTLTVEQHRGMVTELATNDYRWTEEDMERAKQRFGGS